MLKFNFTVILPGERASFLLLSRIIVRYKGEGQIKKHNKPTTDVIVHINCLFFMAVTVVRLKE